MTLRDEFEKLCPVPGGVEYSESRDAYFGLYDALSAGLYDSKYQGFLLGRQNTVSVEKHQDAVEAAYSRGFCDRSDLNVGRVVSVEKYQEDVEQAHMAGQAEAGIDPSYSNAQLYYDRQAKRRTEEV